MRTADVLMVGAGPVGTVTALALANQNTIFESARQANLLNSTSMQSLTDAAAIS